MITPHQFLDAVADFEGLVADGDESRAAIVEAAKANGIDPDVFEKRLSRELSLESRVERIRREVDHDRFVALAKSEVAKCNKREDRYKAIGIWGDGAEEQIAEEIGAVLGRPLTDHETDLIEELWSPGLFDLKRKIRFGIEPSRQRPFRSEDA